MNPLASEIGAGLKEARAAWLRGGDARALRRRLLVLLAMLEEEEGG